MRYGYLQKAEVDIDQTFVAVVKEAIAFWAFFIIATFYNLDIE